VTETDTEGRSAADATITVADLWALLRRGDVFAVGLWVIVAAQAVWLAILMHSGWYYQADFDNLASATGHSLSWSYLTTSQGGHLDIVGRLVLWVLNRTIPLNYNATIGLRLVASAGVTYLLGRLLRELVGPRRGVLALLALFALSPMLVQSTLWLTSAINFLISELLVLGALRSHVRYALTGRLRWAVLTGLAMLGATLVAEQAAVTALVLPILTFGFLAEGGWRQRFRAVLRSWPAWLLVAVPIMVFASFYFASGKYVTRSSGFSAGDGVKLVSTFWFDTLVPGLFGGPLAWRTPNGNFFAFDAAPLALRVVAVGLLVLAVAWSVRRTSARALFGWAIPVLVSGIGIVFVGVARYEVFGVLTAQRFEYASYAAIPAAVGIALALWATSSSDIGARVGRGAQPILNAPLSTHPPRVTRWTGRLLVAVLGLASVISGATYAHHWSQSPSRSYVDRLADGLAQAGDNVTVFDTFVAADVMPGIQSHRHVSDLLALMGAHPHLDNGPLPVRIVNGEGRLVTAQFLTTASVPVRHHNSFCNDLITPQVTKPKRLDTQPPLNEWFLALTYFEQVPTVLNVHAVTAQGTILTPFGGSRVVLASRIGKIYLRLPPAVLAAIRVQGTTSSTNVCLTNISVGYPFPAK
jgi:hypothetical protein